MGVIGGPEGLSDSGERSVQRLVELQEISLPTSHIFVPIASAVEVHASEMIRRLVRHSNVDDTPLGAALLGEMEGGMTRTWNDRWNWLRDGFQVSIAGTSAAQEFDTLVEVRNAVAHGNGELSDEQRRLTLTKRVALVRDMKRQLDVSVNGGLRFGPDSSHRAFLVARSFIHAFDGAILRRYPSVAIR